MALPNFFIIGAAKAGTTSLHHYLDQHPEIQMAAVKETNFFAGPEEGLPYPVGRIADLAQYESLFDPAYRMRGEASPSYTNDPRRAGVPERIKAMVPQARFVYLVRDPIARTISHYRMLAAEGKEARPLDRALDDLAAVDPYEFRLTSQSFYARQLERYLGCFAADRILVLDQADLRTRRKEALAEVFGFLGVAREFDSAEFEVELLHGSEWHAYPPFFRRHLEPALAVPWRRLPRGFRAAVRGRVERRLPKVPEPELNEASRLLLAELFAADVERLRRLTGKPLAAWSI
jgi:hypothetical protein